MSKDIVLIYRDSKISKFEIIAARNNDYLCIDSVEISMKPFLEPPTKATTILLSILMLTSTAAIVGTAFHPANAASPSTPTFTNYELAGNPFRHGFSVGVTCPNGAGTCQNTDGEPAIRADPAGNFYGSSENVFCVIGGLCGGTFAWKSTDNGNHFTTLPLPDSVSSGSVGFSPAGGDTDIAVAPALNTNGQYNIYVASLATTPPLANVYVSTSHDGGASFTLNPTGATIPVDDREWIAADGANKVCVSYHAYATTNNLFVTCSYDGGTTFAQVANAFDANQPWHGPYQNSKTPSNTAIMPWSAALGNGALDVVWYGTSYYDGVNTPDNYPMKAAWQVYFAQNLAATTPGSKFSQNTASGIIHYGGVCEAGVTCTGNRDLLDDFGIAASPTTGSAAIIYTNDQYLNTAAEPATTRTSGSGVCTQSLSNSVDCSHTDIAIQTGGSTLLSTKHHLRASINFEQLSQTPSLNIQISNIGDGAIASLSIQLSGRPLTLSWNPAMPLQSGQTASTTTTNTPLGLVLTVGGIYQVTITATLSDGSTDSQTLNAIYTLGAGIGL